MPTTGLPCVKAHIIMCIATKILVFD